MKVAGTSDRRGLRGGLRLGAVMAVVVFALLPTSASAHGSSAVSPDELYGWRMLLPDTLTFAGVVGLLVIFGRGCARTAVPTGRVAAFVAGLVVLLVGVSPAMDALAYTLLSAHMVQHLLLLVVSAPLLAYSRPVAPLVLGLPAGMSRGFAAGLLRRARRMSGAPFANVAGALALASVVLWLWHAPVLYEAAVHNAWLHMLEHALFLGTGVLFWATLLPATRGARARNAGSVLVLFAMSIQGAMLGALMAFSSSLWFEHYASTTWAWGVAAMDDQLMAGLLMWMGGGLVYGISAAVLLASSLAALEARMQGEGPALRYPAHTRRGGTHEA